MSTSWAPRNLTPILAGDHIVEEPSLLRREDGVALIYANKQHSAYGEPESCKSWLAARAAVAEFNAGMHVTVIDFEDDAPTWIERMTNLRATEGQIAELFHYVRPEEPITEEGWVDLDPALEHSSLVIIDGTNEGMALHGLNLSDNADVAQWMRIQRRCQRYGGAVLNIDHVTKDRESRGRYAIGGQSKLAAVDVAFSMRVIKPFARGRNGLVAIRVEKDRPGYVRAHQNDDGQIALMRLTSEPDGLISIELSPPEGASASFRPTVLMERLSRAIEEEPGLTKRNLRSAVAGNSKAKDLALALLVAEGFVDIDPSGSGHAHHSVKPFREGGVTTERDHRDHACPSGDQGVTGDRDHRDHPLKRVGTGHTPSEALSLVAAFDDDEAA